MAADIDNCWEDRAPVTATEPNAAINELADRFFEGVLEREPIYATILGDDRFDDRLPDLGAEGAPRRRAAIGRRWPEAEPIDPAGLDPEQVITRDMLILVASTQLEALEQKQYQLAINHISGTQTMPVSVAQYQIAETPEGLEQAADPVRCLSGRRSSSTSTRCARASPTVAPAPRSRFASRSSRSSAWPPLPTEQFPAVALAHVADDDARDRVRCRGRRAHQARAPAPARLPGR